MPPALRGLISRTTPTAPERLGGGGGRILLAFGRVADLEKRTKDGVITETKPDKLEYSGAPSVTGGTGFTSGSSGTVRYL